MFARRVIDMNDFSSRRKISKRIPLRLLTYPAKLGDGMGNLYVPGMEHYVYARVAGIVEKVFNNSIPAEYDLLVTIGYSEKSPGVYQVLSPRTDHPGGANGGSSGGYAPSKRYRWMAKGGGQDPLWVEERQIMSLRVGPYLGMTIQIYFGFSRTNAGSFVFVPFTTKDLSAYIPSEAGKAAFVLVTIDTSGAIVYTDGDDFVLLDMTTVDLMLANIPAAPVNTARRLAAVRLYYGQTVIQEDRDFNTDIVDLRFADFSLSASNLTSRWEPVTNGDSDSTEIVFSNGDIVMTEVEN
jgi:hypothetical protein